MRPRSLHSRGVIEHDGKKANKKNDQPTMRREKSTNTGILVKNCWMERALLFD